MLQSRPSVVTVTPSTESSSAPTGVCWPPPDTTGPRDVNNFADRPKGLVKRAARSFKSGLALANRFAEEWYRQCLAWSYQLRGRIVLFDRSHYEDILVVRVHDLVSPEVWGKRYDEIKLMVAERQCLALGGRVEPPGPAEVEDF